MGVRLSKNLMGSSYEVRHVEVGEVGRKRLKDELGIACCEVDDALKNVDVVILAVPDTLICRLAADIAPQVVCGHHGDDPGRCRALCGPFAQAG